MSGCLAVILCIFFPQLIPFIIIYYLACLVEDLLEFDAVVFGGCEPDESQLGSETSVVGILVVCGFAQVVGAIVCLVVCSKHVVLYIVETAIGVAIVETGGESYGLVAAGLPSL